MRLLQRALSIITLLLSSVCLLTAICLALSLFTPDRATAHRHRVLFFANLAAAFAAYLVHRLLRHPRSRRGPPQ